MEKTLSNLDRRDFLRLTAVAAGGTMLAACGGDDPTATPAGTAPQATTAPPSGEPQPTTAPPSGEPQPTSGAGGPAPTAPVIEPPSTFKESPMTTAMVQSGKLKPVAERLPKKPYVVPHEWCTVGKYGGTMRMGCSSSGTWEVSHFLQESMYGHSPLRFLKDGLVVGPGLAESFTMNDDATEFTFNFREGLKWSDGKPWTTADVIFWWEDMAADENHPDVFPNELKSGKGTAAKMTAVDDLTLKVSFDAPAPLTADNTAMWVKRGIGPHWMQPKHYMQQFHPKYNKKINPKGAWVDTFELRRDFTINKDCPTMTGWMLTSYKEGQFTNWERNPYYWCVDKEGNQLPYIDKVNFTNTQNPEVFKLRIQEGNYDYIHGAHTPLALQDVAGLKRSEPRSKMKLEFWDSGSGTGSIFFLSYDFEDKKYRDVFRDKRFRQAISHAFNRAQAKKVVYFGLGEETTGTLSPKAKEYSVNETGKAAYAEWRDSFVQFDQAKANQLLDEVGLKKGSPFRTFADGAPFKLQINYPATAGAETLKKNQLLVEDLKKVGLNAVLAPIPSEGYDDRWKAGKIQTKTDWEVGDGPNHLLYPQWMVPLEFSRWAPLHGEGQTRVGTPDEKKQLNIDPFKRTPPRVYATENNPVADGPDGPINKLLTLYKQSKIEPDEMKRHQLVWDMIKVHVSDGPFFMGSVANPPRIVLFNTGLKNVPTQAQLKQFAQGGFVNPWIHPTPAVYDPEAYYWDDPAAHSS